MILFSEAFPAAAAAKLLQSCLTLWDPTDCSPPGSTVTGTLQARTLEWVAISFSNAWKWEVKLKSLSRVWLLETPWAAAYQARPSMGFSRQEYWSGLPVPSPAYWKPSQSLFSKDRIFFQGFFDGNPKGSKLIGPRYTNFWSSTFQEM